MRVTITFDVPDTTDRSDLEEFLDTMLGDMLGMHFMQDDASELKYTIEKSVCKCAHCSSPADGVLDEGRCVMCEASCY